MTANQVTLAAALLAFHISHYSVHAGWTNVTHDVGGEKWGYAGVCLLAAVPDSAAVIAGVSEAGLWRTDDWGKSWRPTSLCVRRCRSNVGETG